MRVFKAFLIAGIATAGFAASASAQQRMVEDYVRAPMPPGVQVRHTDLEGPVFTTSTGMTLYVWPQKAMRVGYSGDGKGKSTCTDKVTTQTAGMMSPWPAGMDLPELDKRLSCAATWPAFLAPDDAKPMGLWTVITRPDGKKQWAYDELPVYTSILDKVPGETNGGSGTLPEGGSGTAPARLPVGPRPNVPPGFNVVTTLQGRMVVNDKGYSVYTWDNDAANKSNCTGDCARIWIPAVAPASASPQGEWTIIQRAAGVRQWAFRKKPVYTFSEDTQRESLNGGDVPGWHNVYTQVARPHPSEFTVQNSLTGDLLADAKGKTIYFYTCNDDSFDQLACDTMDSPQVYRLAIAGGGNAERALKMWPYVQAPANPKLPSQLWSVVWVDPKTGHEAKAGETGAQRVWAYRGRPVYTYAGDKEPGDIEGNGMGEWQGKRNGFRAFYVREEFGGRRG
jgi:predicted lipoprotein with Yx(FWY)xxD motif